MCYVWSLSVSLLVLIKTIKAKAQKNPFKVRNNTNYTSTKRLGITEVITLSPPKHSSVKDQIGTDEPISIKLWFG